MNNSNLDLNICQVDTCVISDVLEDKAAQYSFIRFINENQCFIGLSSYTFYELLQRQRIFDKFLEIFPANLIAILKPANMLIEEEMKGYPFHIKINPVFVPPFESFELIKEVFERERMRMHYNHLNQIKGQVLKSVLERKKAFPPNQNGKYTPEARIQWVKNVTKQQLEQFYQGWYESLKSECFDYSIFRSLTAQLYITFLKFYVLKDRKPKNSDIIDIAMTASFPFVDFILTEKNLVNDIRSLQRQKLHFADVTPYTIEEIKRAYPYI